MKQSKKRRSKHTKRGGGCGVLNPNKYFSDNQSNCLKNKDKWNALGIKVKGQEIYCGQKQVAYTNFPSNADCVGDIVEVNGWKE
jgi:hypothetical protein